jgi:WXG100 family type VII secretion target
MAGRILITPEQVDAVAKQFRQSREQSQQIIQRLNQQFHSLEGQWEGMTKQKFFQKFQEANKQMANFVHLLDSISQELTQIADRFRTVDQTMEAAAVLGALGPEFLLGAAGAGAARAMSSGGLDLDIQKYLGETPPNKYGLYGKFLGGEAKAHIPGSLKTLFEDLKTGKLIGAEANASFVEVGLDTEYVEGSVKKLTADAEAGYNDYSIGAGAEASLLKYEGSLRIPLPFTDHKLVIGGEAAFGSLGLEASIGKKTGFYVGAELFGAGASVTIE